MMETPLTENHLNSYVVRDKGGKLKFPTNIPKKRSKMRQCTLGLLILLCALSNFYASNDFQFYLEALSYSIIILHMVEVIDRIILSAEEIYHHFNPRYGNSIDKLLRQTFSFTHETIFMMIFSIMISLHFFMDHGFIDLSKLDKFSFLNILVLLFLLKKVTKTEYAPIYKSLKFEENDGLNYSSAMAHSFFHGYLRLILPNTGGDDKNLIEIIGNYCDIHQVYVFPKLFILVPKSGVCPVTLKNANNPSIEESSSLDEKKLTIAGVQKRVYKNSVYKIRDPKRTRKVHYVCAEYATPLRTFKASVDSSGQYNERFKQHADDIILNFYLITRDLIRNDPEICDMCELIYYDDKVGDKFRDISPILLKYAKPPRNIQLD